MTFATTLSNTNANSPKPDLPRPAFVAHPKDEPLTPPEDRRRYSIDGNQGPMGIGLSSEFSRIHDHFARGFSAAIVDPKNRVSGETFTAVFGRRSG